MAKGWLEALAEAPELKDRVEVVGMVDIDRGAADRLRAEFGLTAESTVAQLIAFTERKVHGK